jgi:group I intron endonuclease
MDYSQVCQGWIYTITNRVNGKMYVGKTVDFTQRKWQHFHREECPALKNAFKKYGIDNFEMKPVLNFYAINKEVLNSVLSWLERFYIAKYDTYRTGYNATKGGEGTLGYEHTEEYKLLMSKKQREYKAQDWVKERDRQRMIGNTLSEECKRPILKYTLDGEFVQEYSWIGEAIDDISQDEKYTNNWRSIHSNLIRALNGNNNKQANNKAYDSMWRYKESDNYLLTIEPFKRKKEKPVYHYSKDGELLESYKTLKEAAAGTGMEIKTIKYMSYNGDLRRKEGRKPKTDYWSRTAPNEK